MHRAVHGLALPAQFEIISVPAGKPQTKPRALNYALQFARGSLVTIYDSEDIPQPNQLYRAAERFAVEDEGLACLQAALCFYNPNENWLTRQFTAEYAGLFKVILPALAESGLPILLGGTSNHFRLDTLKRCGGWDPFNVTEDADLGIRLARLGFRSDVLCNHTYEEANTQFVNWMQQRRRWFKGFLQTWLVHMRQPTVLWRELGSFGFWTVQSFTIGIFASALLHPILLVAGLRQLAPAYLSNGDPDILATVASGASLSLLLSGYGVSMAVSWLGLKRSGINGWSGVLAATPIYWLLMSAAAWLALWDFCVRPYHWHKTRHGLSRQRNAETMRAPVARRPPKQNAT